MKTRRTVGFEVAIESKKSIHSHACVSFVVLCGMRSSERTCVVYQ